METNLPEENGEATSLQTAEFIQHFPMTSEVGNQTDPTSSKRKAGRRKIPIEFIEDKSRRQITFSKRKAGLMKKVFYNDHSTFLGVDFFFCRLTSSRR
jgi:hypothetical protein